jgi:hypothetical protein
MVKFDLLLLPLIGGYIFLITSYFTKFYHQIGGKTDIKKRFCTCRKK